MHVNQICKNNTEERETQQQHSRILLTLRSIRQPNTEARSLMMTVKMVMNNNATQKQAHPPHIVGGGTTEKITCTQKIFNVIIIPIQEYNNN